MRGTGIYAYCIIANTVLNPGVVPATANYSLYIDGEKVYVFGIHTPESTMPEFVYNVYS
jgi:hypothetical protein